MNHTGNKKGSNIKVTTALTYLDMFNGDFSSAALIIGAHFKIPNLRL
jgi:hypothetical protein